MTNITVKQAAALLGVTPQRVRALIKAGMLQAEKWGRDWQIDAESVEKRRKAMEQKIGVSPTRVLSSQFRCRIGKRTGKPRNGRR